MNQQAEQCLHQIQFCLDIKGIEAVAWVILEYR